MTDEELKARAGIQKTLGALAQAGDARKADAYAACFTEDGVLDLTNTGGDRFAGREAVRAWMAAPSPIAQPKAEAGAEAAPKGFVSHHLTTCNITITGPDTASVRTYWLVTSAVGLDHNGYYDDIFRKVGDDWLLESHRPRNLWTAPNSLVRL